jgi:HK97 family phage major capsid protein/HK97 family phage prohead protease
MNRAYSTFEIKSVNDEQRIIEGIATTPTPDRANDIVELDGIDYALPLPFLYQHNSRQPIGQVVDAKIVKNEMRVRIEMASAGVATFIDEAWSLIKAGLIRGLSIGFRSIEDAYNRDTGGVHFIKTEWIELSAVTIPMNAEATILSVKSADSQLLAASGHQAATVVRLGKTAIPPGVPGLTGRKNMTIKEQTVQFENKRAASAARMEALMTKAGDEGRTLDETENAEYDGLGSEIKTIDGHLLRLKEHEKTLIVKATAVLPAAGTDPAAGAGVRRNETISVKSMLPKGTLFSRWVMAQVAAKGNQFLACDIAKAQYPDTPEIEMILRAGVNAGTSTSTTFASTLIPGAQQMVNEFLELLRPASIIGRVPGFTHVPANCIVPIQTGGGTGNWVGETLPKPVSALAFSSATLRWAKAVVLTVLSDELMRFSNPSAEAIVRNSIVKDLSNFIDAQFVGNTIESVNVSPAGIRWNSTTAAATGVTAAAFLTDFRTALGTFITAKNNLSDIVILMSSTVAMNISTLQTSNGVYIYPDLDMVTGGNILGIPVVVSEAVGTNIIFLVAPEILLADDGGVMIDASNQASILMDDAPNASPTTTALVSLYQRNLVAIRTEQYITWKKARSTSTYFISSAAYTG